MLAAISSFVYSIVLRAWRIGLPAGTPPQLTTACRALVPVTAALWALEIAGIWWHWDARAAGVALGAAVATLVLAGMCWIAAIMSADGRHELIRLSADLYERIPEDRRPPLVRSAR
jgi:hypothetical protein